MPELTLRDKRILGDELLSADDDVFANMVVPSEITPEVAAFAAELSPLPPQHVPLIQDDLAAYGWPADGVRARIERDGGDIRFGWRLREWPDKMLMAVFHAIWIDPQGPPIDMTPDTTEGDTSLFVPASPEFDPSQPPMPRYRITHLRPDMSAEIGARIARLKTGQRAYEERRAAKAGKTLEEWFNDKYNPDAMASVLPPFIKACEEFDAKLPTLPEFVSTETPAIEQYLPETSEVSSADPDGSAATADSPGAPSEANSTIDSPSEPGPEPATDAGSPDEVEAADDDFDEGYDPEEDKAQRRLWTAMDKIEEWADARRFFHAIITTGR
ncbi:MAG TPA: hypothetical protein VMU81_30720 [Acetobacteraceae bacterium]|nr:hypothetical protein [Acetobacteraceae bacterium]